VRQFVDEGHLGLPGEDGVEVHLLEDHSPVLLPGGAQPRAPRSVSRFPAGRGSPPGDDDVDPSSFKRCPREHLVRLPDTGAVPEVDLQPSSPGAADQSEKIVGPFFRHFLQLPSRSRFSISTFTALPEDSEGASFRMGSHLFQDILFRHPTGRRDPAT